MLVKCSSSILWYGNGKSRHFLMRSSGSQVENFTLFLVNPENAARLQYSNKNRVARQTRFLVNAFFSVPIDARNGVKKRLEKPVLGVYF